MHLGRPLVANSERPAWTYPDRAERAPWPPLAAVAPSQAWAYPSSPAGLAQWPEQPPCERQVEGSTPSSGTTNPNEEKMSDTPSTHIANTRVPEFIKRLANLMATMEEAREDIKALTKEAKEEGLNPTVLKKVVRILADDTGKMKMTIENDIAELLSYMRDAGEPMEID